MINRLLLVLFFFCFHFGLQAENIHYHLKDDPIDVVIVAHPKDQGTLDYCIDGIRENCSRIRRVIVVSAARLTDKAEWFDEKKFPFNKDQISYVIRRGDKKKIESFKKHCSPGWYLQQLLKLYSSFVIPGISSNVLVIDADTIFMNPIDFLNDANGGLFCVTYQEGNEVYFKHAERLVPGYTRTPGVYSVSHHMLFQRDILEDLFTTVEHYHHTPFWRAFCICVDPHKCRGASEYEIYYNFAIHHTDQVETRYLNWQNSAELDQREQFKKEGYHFVSFHSYMRKNKIVPLENQPTEL